MKKRNDECFKCSRRKCRTRIVTPDMKYDELACDEHIRDLELNTDKILGCKNGVMRHHISSSAQVHRGQMIESYPEGIKS